MDKYKIDGHKLLWHLDRVSAWQKDRLITPVYLEISPVAFCNHKCIFCGIDFAKNRGIKLDADVLCTRIEEMGQLGVRSIMFAGEGEPLLHKELPRLIKTAKQSGIDVSITTNGTPANYDVWKELLPDLEWVRFSVDAGSADVYAHVHGVQPSAFDHLIRSLTEANQVKRELGLSVTIGVQFLIIDENLADLENALRLYSELNVDYISLKPYSLHPQMIEKKDVEYSDAIVTTVEQVVEQFRKKSKTTVIFRKEALQKYCHGERTYDHCYALPFWGYISSKGDFYTCSVYIGDERFRTGNINDNTMEQIFTGKARKASIEYGEQELDLNHECRLNCRMARINEFLALLEEKPDHINFI